MFILRKRLLPFVVAACWLLGNFSSSNAGESEGFDFEPWRRVLVFHNNRIKPFDTAAREAVLELTGRAEFKPDHFYALSVSDVTDWPKLVDLLKAPPANGERTEPANDGRTDRFKTGNAGDATPLVRLREMLTPALRRQLRDTDFSVDSDLSREWEKLERDLYASRDQVFPVEANRRPLAELREQATAKKLEPILELFKRYDSAVSKWQAIQLVKAKLLAELNSILMFPQFYDSNYWVNRPLPEAAMELKKTGQLQLPEHQLAFFNRHLLSMSLGETIAAAPKSMGKFDPIAGKKYDPVELYLTWLFTWGGWEKILSTPSEKISLDPEMYRQLHEPDGWDHCPLLLAGFHELKPFLVEETDHHVSPVTPYLNASFVSWTQRLAGELEGLPERHAELFEKGLTETERRGLKAARAGMTFRVIRQGLHFQLGAPMEGEPAWLPLLALVAGASEKLKSPYDAKLIAELRGQFRELRSAFLAGDTKTFNRSSESFVQKLSGLTDVYHQRLLSERKLEAERSQAKMSASGLAVFDFLDAGKNWDPFPTPAAIEREIHYNHFQPFWKSAIGGFIATLLLATGLAVRNRPIHYLGMIALFGGMGLMLYGLYLRVEISGRAPVTNMYETIIWASLVGNVLAIVLGFVYKLRVLALAAAVILAFTNAMAVNLPPEFGSAISPLQPVLRSQKWLVIHVMTIVASYGAFMLAWILSTIGLAYFFRPTVPQQEIKSLAKVVYNSMQVGTLLLVLGTGLGAWWAADSWGRFWGWDPKEVWALIAFLSYMLVLHSRYAGVKSFGTMVGSSLAFTMVVGSWYGVNFIFPAGKHAYAFNTGGQLYVIAGVLINLAYVALVCGIRTWHQRRAKVLTARLESPREESTVSL